MINKMIITSIMKKLIIRYRLNMDYKIEDLSLEKQTNFLINDIINDLYKKIDNSKIIVYEYNDDLISLIGYNILKAVQAIKPFELKICGKKPKKTKKKIKAKESLTALIEKKKAELDSRRPLTEGEVQRLYEDFMIEYTYNSNAIEGNTLNKK